MKTVIVRDRPDGRGRNGRERDTIVTAKGGKDSEGRMAKYERKNDEILRMQALNWGALHPRWAGKRIKRRSDFSWLRHVQSNQVPGGCSKLARKRDACTATLWESLLSW